MIKGSGFSVYQTEHVQKTMEKPVNSKRHRLDKCGLVEKLSSENQDEYESTGETHLNLELEMGILSSAMESIEMNTAG